MCISIAAERVADAETPGRLAGPLALCSRPQAAVVAAKHAKPYRVDHTGYGAQPCMERKERDPEKVAGA